MKTSIITFCGLLLGAGSLWSAPTPPATPEEAARLGTYNSREMRDFRLGEGYPNPFVGIGRGEGLERAILFASAIL